MVDMFYIVKYHQETIFTNKKLQYFARFLRGVSNYSLHFLSCFVFNFGNLGAHLVDSKYPEFSKTPPTFPFLKLDIPIFFDITPFFCPPCSFRRKTHPPYLVGLSERKLHLTKLYLLVRTTGNI